MEAALLARSILSFTDPQLPAMKMVRQHRHESVKYINQRFRYFDASI